MVKELVKYIFVLLLTLPLWGQDALVELEVEPKVIETGQTCKITIRTNVEGFIEMDLPDEFIQSGPRSSGAHTEHRIIDGKQTMVQTYYQTFTGYFEQEGDYSIGPVVIDTRTDKHSSKAQKVKVFKPINMISEDPSKNLNQMMFGVIRQSKKEIYEGESVVVEGKIYSQVEVLQFEDFGIYTFSEAVDSKPLGNVERARSEFEVINGRNLQTFRLGKTVVFPGLVGDYKIFPFEAVVTYNNYQYRTPATVKITSNESTLKVKPLPNGMPTEFIDAVGKFEVQGKVLTPKVTQGEVLEVELVVKGEGNLQNITHPKLNLPEGLTLYADPEVVDDFSYTVRGAEGNKKFTYFIRVNTAEDVNLPVVKIAYFDPVSEKYETSSCSLKTVKVIPNKEFEEIEDVLVEEQVVLNELEPFLKTKEASENPSIYVFSKWGTPLLLSPIMLGAFAGVLVRRKEEKETKQTLAEEEIRYRTNALAKIAELKAHQESDNSERVSDISLLLKTFLAEKYGIDRGGVCKGFLQNKNVDKDLSDESYHRLKALFDELDVLKYSGFVENVEVDHLLAEAEEIINKIG